MSSAKSLPLLLVSITIDVPQLGQTRKIAPVNLVYMRIFSLSLFLVLSTVSLTVLGQTGPGGVGSSSNNLVWFDADSGTFTDGGTTAAGGTDLIQQWNDQSGNGNNLSQLTSNDRPRLQTSVVNGHNIVRFDGSSDFFSISLGALGAPVSVVGVFYFDNLVQPNGNNDYIYNLGAGSGSVGINSSISRTAGNFGPGGDTYYLFDGTAVNLGPVLTGQTYNIFSQINRSAATRHNLFIDGTSQSVTDYGSALSTSGLLNIGRYQNGVNGLNHLDGDIGEFALFNVELNTAQRKIIENYFSSKYSIAIANDLYTHDAGHGHQVIGIGRDDVSNEHTDARGNGVVQVNTAASLGDGDFMLIGHDNAGISTITSDLPVAMAGTGSRIAQEWRVDQTGTVGTVTVVFDLTGWSFSNPGSYELLIDADGDFTAGATRHTTGLSFDAGTDELTFTTADLCDGCFFTLASDSGEVNSIVASGNWSSTSSWDCGCVPGEGQIANIVAGHNITVDVNSSVLDLNIAATGTLSFSAGAELDVNGDLVNTGSIAAGTGKFIFSGASAQTFTNNSTTVSLNDLTLDNSNGLTVSNGEFRLAGKIALMAGNLHNTATFTLLSSDTRTAAITDGTGTISGSYTVQRHVKARSANWGEIAPPVSTVDISNWDTDIFMSGVGGNDGNACCPIFFSVYKYNNLTDAYVAVTSTAETVAAGEGIQLFLASSLTSLDTFTFQSKGSISLADAILSINSAGGGYNLLGNPYPSFLSWTAISASNGGIVDAFQIFSDSTGNYLSKGDGDFISPHQGFWVESTASSIFTISPTHIIDGSTSGTFLRRDDVAPEYLELELTTDVTPFSHHTFIGFNELANASKDNFDLSFLPSPQDGAPNITSVVEDGRKLYRNVLPVGEEYVTVPLKVNVDIAGVYHLKADEFSAVGEYDCILLEDISEGVTIDLKELQDYGFEMKDVTKDREFRIHLISSNHEDCDVPNVPQEVVAVTNDFNIEQLGNQVFVNFDLEEMTNASIAVYNLLGQQMTETVSIDALTQRYNVELPENSGTFMVVVKTDTNVLTRKVYLSEN